MTLKVEQGRVVEARFLAKGCVPAIACASALTELVQGRTLSEAAELTREEIVGAVGGVPEASVHASHLAMDALQQALVRLKT